MKGHGRRPPTDGWGHDGWRAGLLCGLLLALAFAAGPALGQALHRVYLPVIAKAAAPIAPPTLTPRPTLSPPPTGTAGPSPGATPTPSVQRVAIVDFAFDPATITVETGTVVEWVNRGQVTHTSTSDTGLWDSGRILRNATFSRTFVEPGPYPYHCAIHPSMHGTIIVRGLSVPPSPVAEPPPPPG